MSQYHQLFFDPSASQCTFFRNPDGSARGPDLGFMPLNHETLSSISGRKSFYNLTMRCERMLKDPPQSELGAWFISGLADEWTKDGETPGTFEKMKVFRGMIGEVKLGARHTTDSFDYRVVNVQVDPQSGWPYDFGGYSGSSIWHLLVKETNGEMQIAHRLLSGVVFYQSDPLDADGSTMLSKDASSQDPTEPLRGSA